MIIIFAENTQKHPDVHSNLLLGVYWQHIFLDSSKFQRQSNKSFIYTDNLHYIYGNKMISLEEEQWWNWSMNDTTKYVY